MTGLTPGQMIELGGIHGNSDDAKNRDEELQAQSTLTRETRVSDKVEQQAAIRL
jgi:hypothetical protein